MKSSPIASVEAKDLEVILTNPVVMLYGAIPTNETSGI